MNMTQAANQATDQIAQIAALKNLEAEFKKKVQALHRHFSLKAQQAQKSGHAAEVNKVQEEYQIQYKALRDEYVQEQKSLSQGAIVRRAQVQTQEEELKATGTEGVPIPSRQPSTPLPQKQSPLRLVETKASSFEQPDGKLYDPTQTSIDLDLAVYSGDREGVMWLLSDDRFVQASDELMKANPDYNHRGEMLKKCMRLSHGISPRIDNIIKKCVQAVQLKIEVETYVYHDAMFNAAVFPPQNGHVILMLTSSLLEKFDDTELTFVIGHEIGHFLFQHHRFPTSFLLAQGQDMLSPMHAMKLSAWNRSAEVSADRIGLLCAQDFEAAARAFFKFSSGITESINAFHIEQYIKQFNDLKTEMQKEDMNPNDWYSTHPFSPLRIKALELFKESVPYWVLQGMQGGNISKPKMEQEIKDFMSLMEPNYQDDKTKSGQLKQQFVFIGGFAIAAANGIVEESEVMALATIVSPETVKANLPKVKGQPLHVILEAAKIIAQEFVVHTSRVERFNVIRDLAIVVYADGSVEQGEMEVLYFLCQICGVNPDFANFVIKQATRGLD